MEIALLSQAVSLFAHADTVAKGKQAEDSESFASLLGEFDTPIDATAIDIDIAPMHPMGRPFEVLRGEERATLTPIISGEDFAGTPVVKLVAELGNDFERVEEPVSGAKQHNATGLEVLTKKTTAEVVTFGNSVLPGIMFDRTDLGSGDVGQESSDPVWPLKERGAIANLAETGPVLVEKASNVPVSVRSEELIASERKKGPSFTQIAQDKAPRPLLPKAEKTTTDDVIGKSAPVPAEKASLDTQMPIEAQIASRLPESESGREPSIFNSGASREFQVRKGLLAVEPERMIQHKRSVSTAQFPRENSPVAPQHGTPLADFVVPLRVKPPLRVPVASDIASSTQTVDLALKTEAEIKVQFAPVPSFEDRPILASTVSDFKRSDPPNAPKQVTEQLQVMLRAKNTGATEITLQPEELGKVRLQISNAENGLVVSIQAERSETLEHLRRQVESLAADLAGQGHDAARFDFSAWSDQDGGETDSDAANEGTAELSCESESFAPAPSSQLNRKEDGSMDIRL